MSPASTDETDLEMVRRHVREGAGHVANQRALIVRLRKDGILIEVATALLATFEASQGQHEAHLARLEGAAAIKSTSLAADGLRSAALGGS